LDVSSSSNLNRASQDQRKKQDEAEFINDLQYNTPKKKRKKSGNNLNNLQAFGVFTDQGIHISCAGCPIGWPEMLTVYPEYEVGIPVTCSNCPNNWPGALNLLGIGGDQSWQQRPQSSRAGRGRGRGNSFGAFDADSNFGGQPASVDFGNNFNGAGDEENDDDTPPPSRRRKKNGKTKAPAEEDKMPAEKETKKPTDEDENDEGFLFSFFYSRFFLYNLQMRKPEQNEITNSQDLE
jgi:hypothetical protein